MEVMQNTKEYKILPKATDMTLSPEQQFTYYFVASIKLKKYCKGQDKFQALVARAQTTEGIGHHLISVLYVGYVLDIILFIFYWLHLMYFRCKNKRNKTYNFNSYRNI